MKIEILYSEICNLYGDYYNHIYLEKNLNDKTIYKTSLYDTPKFINEDIDLIYIGSASETNQLLIIEKLMPYKEKLKEMIENNKVIIATGNSFEIFGKYIYDETLKQEIPCLNIFDYYAKRDMNKRHNSLFLGEFNNFSVVGHKSQFSFIYGVNEDNMLFKLNRGTGNNKEQAYEGFKYKNFYGTYVLGPLLVFNPLFTKYIFKILNIDKKLIFEEEAMDAYKFRLKEFQDPKTEMGSKH